VSHPCAAPGLGRGSVVEPVLDNPKPFIELVLDVPGGGRSEFAWEGRAPARPRYRGVAHLRYAWTLGGLCRRAGARQPETLHRAGARRSRGRAFRVCLGGTSTSSSAVPGCSSPALRLDLGGAVSSSRCSTTRNPSSSWCSTF